MCYNNYLIVLLFRHVCPSCASKDNGNGVTAVVAVLHPRGTHTHTQIVHTHTRDTTAIITVSWLPT